MELSNIPIGVVLGSELDQTLTRYRTVEIQTQFFESHLQSRAGSKTYTDLELLRFKILQDWKMELTGSVYHISRSFTQFKTRSKIYMASLTVKIKIDTGTIQNSCKSSLVLNEIKKQTNVVEIQICVQYSSGRHASHIVKI